MASSASLIRVTYQATAPDDNPASLAERIAREQSLEILDELIPSRIREQFLGQVLAVQQTDDRQWSLTIGYPAHLASRQLGQLVQLIYGNVSFYPRIRLIDLSLPEELTNAFSGPRAGVAGIRQWIDVPDRALLLTVLKPRGSDFEQLAALAESFALGGGDILKDDQNLVETSIEAFKARVSACADAIDGAAQRTGRRCLYLPNVSGSGSHLQAQLEYVAERELPGVVLCPWFMGLETASTAADRCDLMWLAHPAGAGVYTESDVLGIAAPVLFGQLTRLAGADLTIFPGQGGRISLAANDQDLAIAGALRRPIGSLQATLPCTGGGKTLAQAPEQAKRLGSDCAIVVGGDLLRQRQRIQEATERAIASLS